MVRCTFGSALQLRNEHDGNTTRELILALIWWRDFREGLFELWNELVFVNPDSQAEFLASSRPNNPHYLALAADR